MKHSVKSTAVSLLLTLLPSLPAGACIWFNNHNNYLYSLYDSQEFQYRANETCNANWKTYLGLTDDNYFWFNAEEVAEAARKKGDPVMASYVNHLQRYLKCAESVRDERWDYPTKEQLTERRLTLQKIKAYAQGKLTTRLRSQHALLLMRCNMLLGQHQANVSFWEQTASKYIETVYKDMMYDIYGGALLHSGRGDEAGRVFAELGDWQSLMTQFYQRRSYQAISEEYHRDNNSPVLPFLLQDFVNNAQEAVDTYDEYQEPIQGKLFVRDIERSEAMQMCQLARQAASSGKSRQPVMWQSALAWLEYLFGDKAQAQKDIARTTAMEGTQTMKDCARILRLYLSAVAPAGEATGTTAAAVPAVFPAALPVSPSYDTYVARELQWIDSLSKRDGKYIGMKERIVHQQLVPLYERSGRRFTAMALLHSVDAYCYNHNLDTMSVASLQQFWDYAKNPGPSALDRYMAADLSLDDNDMRDLLGTKHLRLCQWAEAQKWLQQVPASYYDKKGYAVYALYRKWNVEPWIKRQWLKEGMEYEETHEPLTANPKLLFTREMQQMEQGMGPLNGLARQQRCYDLAVRYAQVAFTGDCWFIMRDGKSVSDTLRTNETDLQARARDLLRQASTTTDAKLREKALFALAYGGLYSEEQLWYKSEWDDQLAKYVSKSQKQSPQYQAFTTLYKTVAGTESPYVSRCDEYRRYKRLR